MGRPSQKGLRTPLHKGAYDEDELLGIYEMWSGAWWNQHWGNGPLPVAMESRLHLVNSGKTVAAPAGP